MMTPVSQMVLVAGVVLAAALVGALIPALLQSFLAALEPEARDWTRPHPGESEQ